MLCFELLACSAVWVSLTVAKFKWTRNESVSPNNMLHSHLIRCVSGAHWWSVTQSPMDLWFLYPSIASRMNETERTICTNRVNSQGRNNLSRQQIKSSPRIVQETCTAIVPTRWRRRMSKKKSIELPPETNTNRMWRNQILLQIGQTGDEKESTG